MRELVTLLICLALFFIALQLKYIRTGPEFENLSTQVENLQSANERLSEEIKRFTLASDALAAQKAISELTDELAKYRMAEAEKARSPLPAEKIPLTTAPPSPVPKRPKILEEPIGEEGLNGEDGYNFDAGYDKLPGK